jgi:hypothetical protein
LDPQYHPELQRPDGLDKIDVCMIYAVRMLVV